VAYDAPSQCDYASNYNSSLDVDEDETTSLGAWSYMAEGIGYRTFDNAWVTYLGQNFSVPDNSKPEIFIWDAFAVSLVAFNTRCGYLTLWRIGGLIVDS